MLLDDMDLDVDIDNISFLDKEELATKNDLHVSTFVVQDEIFSDEENFDIQNALFNKYSKKMIF
jgi:hypothetical protein